MQIKRKNQEGGGTSREILQRSKRERRKRSMVQNEKNQIDTSLNMLRANSNLKHRWDPLQIKKVI